MGSKNMARLRQLRIEQGDSAENKYQASMPIIKTLAKLVSHEFGLLPSDIFIRSRLRELVTARSIISIVMTDQHNFSSIALGEILSCGKPYDHSSILNLNDVANEQSKRDIFFKNVIFKANRATNHFEYQPRAKKRVCNCFTKYKEKCPIITALRFRDINKFF